MHTGIFTSHIPLAATMDLQGRLPPFQQVFFTPTIIVTIILMLIALGVVIYMSYRAKMRAKVEVRRDALKMAGKIILKRGGTSDDASKVLYILKTHTSVNPGAVIMIREKFMTDMRPLLDRYYGPDFAAHIESIYYPPVKDPRKDTASRQQDTQELIEETKTLTAPSQTAAAILDLMDATLRPGTMARLTFAGIEGGYECLVMGHDMQFINFTLPANNNQLVSSIKPGTKVEGYIESGPSLLAFQAEVMIAVAGSMPYCRLSAWSAAWEVRKRDSVRLPISVDIDFQHISTSASASIKMANLDKELGAIRPGVLVDISLGGCGIETPSAGIFQIGDIIRFSKALVTGTPPATLLGAVVNMDELDPALHAGNRQRLHIQFLVIDDVSQRILVRTIRQLQDLAAREEWIKSQTLLQKMRRNRIDNIGSPASANKISTRSLKAVRPGSTTRSSKSGTTSLPPARKPSTRSLPKIVPPRPSTRSLPKPQARPSGRSQPRPPPPS